MLMRGAGTMMAGGMMMTSMAFMAGIGLGLGLGAAAVGGACLARQAMKRRNEWRDDHHSTTLATDPPLPGDDLSQPGAMPAG
jgi:hypothetical protein